MLKTGGFALTALLAVMTGLGPLSTDMYLPSLPSIAGHFGVGAGEAQLTLSVYLIGFALGQILYGPWSDRVGRRPIILIGLAIYGFGSAAAAVAPDLWLLIAARAAQGFGAAGPLVLARAVVRDLYSGTEAARQLSRMGTIMGLVPAIAPVLGAGLEILFGWQANFLFALLFAMIIAGLVQFRLPETLTMRITTDFRLPTLFGDFRALVVDRRFLPFALLSAVSYCGLFAFISGSSFVLQGRYGLDPVVFALSFGGVVIGYILGTIVAQWLVARHGIETTITLGASLLFSGGSIMLILMMFSGQHSLEVTLPMAVYACGVGCVLPQSAAGALMPFPERAGTASSLIGIIQMSLAAILGSLVGQAIEKTALALPLAVAAMGFLALLLALRVRREVSPNKP